MSAVDVQLHPQHLKAAADHAASLSPEVRAQFMVLCKSHLFDAKLLRKAARQFKVNTDTMEAALCVAIDILKNVEA
jgi:hypothetical protein